MEQKNTSGTTTAAAPLVPLSRPGLQGSSGFLLLLMLTLACAAMGIGISAMRTTSQTEVTVAEIVCGVVGILLLVHTWRISRPLRGVIPLLVLAAVLLVYLTDSLIHAGVLVALVCGVTTGALTLTLTTRKQAVWLPLAVLLAYGATLLCSRDPIGSIACLLPLPAAWALSFGTVRSASREDGPTRVGVICLTSLVLLLSLGGMLALSLYRQLGSLSIETLSTALDAARESIIGQFMAIELPENTPDEMRDLLSRENVTEMVNATINLLPGYILAVVNVLAFTAQMLLQVSLTTFGLGASITDRVRLFRMSAVSCAVFFVAYLVALFGNTEVSSLPGTVAQNIYLVLMPGLAFSGILRLLGKPGRRVGCLSMLLVMIAPLLFFIAPFVLAVIEVFGRVRDFLVAKLPRNPDDPSGTPPEDRL